MKNIDDNLQISEVENYNTLIIGSGAAGLNCALHLVEGGLPANKLAILTEKLGAGTSFNAGSDKQTYYKLSLTGEVPDSPYEMAKDYFDGGAMHGDIAFIESVNSVREFFHLIQLGVPFPHDKYGGYVGYKTDNDPRQRATSIGPLTSQKMCECLLTEVKNKGIPIIDNHYALKILINSSLNPPVAIGLIALNLNSLSTDKNLDDLISSIKIFQAKNIVLATGGPAALYKHSVYPHSQWGGMSLGIEAGCKLQNLTESQFGLASIQFRWNVSGSYQQVIPAYVSRDEKGNEKEFLNQYFPSFKELSKAIFLKGYQWPFNAERIENYGSSLIDLAVYYETEVLGNQVFLDFRRNPEEYEENLLDSLAKSYLINSTALANTPIERLKLLNSAAIDLYQENGIDLTQEPLEIAVCNQHLNGGIAGDFWWETNIKHIFAIGEINGSHGIHRPGGAALNAGQVGGLRAAQKILNAYSDTNYSDPAQFQSLTNLACKSLVQEFNTLLSNADAKNPNQFLLEIHNRMAHFGSIVRPLRGLKEEINKVISQLKKLPNDTSITNNREILSYLRVKDALLTQFYMLQSILSYHEHQGASRGSYLILRDNLRKDFKERYCASPKNLKQFKFIKSNRVLTDQIQTLQDKEGKLKINWEQVREIPTDFGWFEKVWKDFTDGKIFF